MQAFENPTLFKLQRPEITKVTYKLLYIFSQIYSQKNQVKFKDKVEPKLRYQQ